jgi:hypothetical protein
VRTGEKRGKRGKRGKREVRREAREKRREKRREKKRERRNEERAAHEEKAGVKELRTSQSRREKEAHTQTRTHRLPLPHVQSSLCVLQAPHIRWCDAETLSGRHAAAKGSYNAA